MSQGIKITTKDICTALDIGRHQIRTWAETLAPYSSRATRERSANRYDSGDLLFFAVVKYLHESLGVSIPFISGFSESLYACVREPQDPGSTPFIFISAENRKCIRLVPEEVSQQGIVVDLQPAQAQVYKFLGISTQQQAQLQLGLIKVN
ncbi:hypothetical protein FKG94_02545 [Exilibacterium tricleocarpae]|uniref:MerR family transcriptional regulator n=1 Tax=Exilibacterium tricleocarpae TaxID=2591008 RepID=A0A545U8E3_9GAMM|nr:hypothetical protein [Exilibacterium tricleocarpae]TQV85740.1 hypothetical protein FKG94_02545 [Exilibacterium tricleocarpae]